MTLPQPPKRNHAERKRVGIAPSVPHQVPYDWLVKVAALRGKALHLGIALAWLAATRRGPSTLLTGRVRARWHLSRYAAYDCLRRLEQAGLVRVWRLPGRSPHIVLTEPGTDTPLHTLAHASLVGAPTTV